ncbi:MAG: UrcA family protein [Candidatus Azotimanducaceae bacterium]|jgi:UrcA family protein
MKKILLAVSCIAISLGANASVKNSDSVESIRVNINDINMTSEVGQEKLYQRISRVARTVCGSTIRSDVGSLKELMENRNCIKQATAEAMNDSGASFAAN